MGLHIHTIVGKVDSSFGTPLNSLKMVKVSKSIQCNVK